MKVSVVGAHGQIGLLLTKLLIERGDEVVACVRKREQAVAMQSLGASAVVVDLESIEEQSFAAKFDGSNAVVFTAGSGGKRVNEVDRDGSFKSVKAAMLAGAQRFVQISAIAADGPLPEILTGPDWDEYYAAKRAADNFLRKSALDWAIIRPGYLNNNPGTGNVELQTNVPLGAISREDVALVIVEVLKADKATGVVWELVAGENPAKDAVAALL